MDLPDLLHFFLGDADTIRRLAANPWTLAVGAVLVLSAGLARNYDTHDLRRQWWRLLLPFAASTAAATVLFFGVAALIHLGVPLAPLGWGILGLFWLTAPFAWLYGLPFERYLPPTHVFRARLAAHPREGGLPSPRRGLEPPPAPMARREVAVPVGCLSVLALALASCLLSNEIGSTKRWHPAHLGAAAAEPAAGVWLFAAGAVL